ncbi:MAG TPA: hypothetical protein V6C95_18270 [Coleofasciculaceae cyanobacterium]
MVTVSKKLSVATTFVVLSLVGLNQKIPAIAQAQPNQLNSATYLYGEAPQPNQLSQTYVVFQHQNGKVVGAIYSPNSEFDCFIGSQSNKILNLKSVSSESVGAAQINLSKLHPIKTVSINDQRMLSACKQTVE